MGKYYLGQESGTQTNFSVVDASGVISDLGLSGLYLSVTGALTSGSELLYGDGSGRFDNVTIGSGLLFTGGVLHATGGGGVGGDADTLNGESGSFYRNAANLTGTLFVEITGTVPDSEKLNGQSGSYYRDITNITGALTTGSSLLYGDGSGRFANASIGSGLLFSGGVLHATGDGGGGSASGSVYADFIQFNTGTTGAGTTPVGELEWADDLGTLKLGLKGGNITHYIGQQLHERVVNKTTGTLEKGTVVFVSGAQGNRITVEKAIATADATSATVFGVTAESIASEAEGFVTQDGLIQGLNTTGFAEGSVLWLSPTVSGGITTTKPFAPEHLVMVGFCIRSHQSAGEILVKIQNGYEINELHNVRITGEANGQILAYNTASGVWYNANLTGGANIAVTSDGTSSITIATTSGSYTGTFVGTASNAELLDNLDSTYFRNGANLTGTINATQLDGQLPAYYRNAANLSGTAQLTGSFTGSFSGNLTGTASNADFLDGLDSTYFRNGANLTGTINATQLNSQSAAYYLNYANLTGTPQVSGSFTGTLSGTASNADFLDNLDSTYFRNAANLSGTAQLSGSFTGSFSGNLTGTASNADFLDNLDSTYFRNAANLTGTASLSGTFSGVFRSNESTTGSASINLPHGTAPTSPVNGDLWTTNSGLYVQISGSTVGPLSTGGGGGGGGGTDEFARTIALIGL